eukprot:1466643-Prymnesium_polylepis.1
MNHSAWLVRAGKEQELKPRLIDPGGTPPNAGRHSRRATDSAMSPVQFSGHSKPLRTKAGGEAGFTKRSGGRQRKLKIAQNVAARGSA